MTLAPETPGTQSLMPPAEELAGRLFEASVGAMDVFAVYLGEKLGYYRSLHADGPATSAELAIRTSTQERYCREWLEQQVTTGILSVSNNGATPSERIYELPAGYDGVLVDHLSELFVAPMGRFLVAAIGRGQDLLDAYRHGGGVSWQQFGDDARTAQSDFNRPFFHHHLVQDYLKAIPGLDASLSRPGARVAEVGSGGGWAAIAIARAYPGAAVDGFDIDGPSVEMARRNAAEADVAGNLAFHHRDAAEAGAGGQFDLVCAFECIHDMPDPVGVLRTMRDLAKPGGTVLVMDERVGDTFGNVGDFNERMFYGFSVCVCLPDGMSHQPSAGTGTVMRAPTLRAYAKRAGFSDAEVLPLEHELFQFYRLVP